MDNDNFDDGGNHSLILPLIIIAMIIAMFLMK